jgi:2,3-bisphosphoglycerate-dependent phosphoglycerate mutase
MSFFVRHAKPVIPRPGGPDDYHRPLTREGKAQAEQLVDELAKLKPTLIASSPYLRAIQTVEPLARAIGIPVRTDHDLREWDSGCRPTPDYARPAAESLHQLTDRATTILTSLAREHRAVVVGSHGTLISRALVGFGLTTVDWAFSQAMPMPAIYRLHFADDQVTAMGRGL